MNIGAAWGSIARAQPEAPALLHGDSTMTWAGFDAAADALGGWLQTRPGLDRQSKVALYLRNRPEYLITLFASFKAGLVPVNTNYRYTDAELEYLWRDADIAAVVFDADFAGAAGEVRPLLPEIGTWISVGKDPPSWSTPFDAAAAPRTEDKSDSGADDDLLLLYTGGTTGMPKGTMWRQDDLFWLLNSAMLAPYPETNDVEAVGRLRRERGPGLRNVVACPLMHGTGGFVGLSTLIGGGCVITLTSGSFDAVELFDTVEREQAAGIAIVGDPFARPMLAALGEHPGRWSLDSLRIVYSSGAMWSQPIKQQLAQHLPSVALVDGLGSSEALGMGVSISGAASTSRTASFTLGANAVVITDDGRLVEPGSGEIGRLGTRGRVPIGYYKDPERSARTFPVIDGVRYSVPGDAATVAEDGSIILLGRGSVVINTGGEKVFPEEVEEALKTHSLIVDAVAVGIPDDTFGEAVTGVVEIATGATLDERAVIDHVKEHLASYKAPKRLVVVPSIGRSSAGKADYGAARKLAMAALAGDG